MTRSTLRLLFILGVVSSAVLAAPAPMASGSSSDRSSGQGPDAERAPDTRWSNKLTPDELVLVLNSLDFQNENDHLMSHFPMSPQEMAAAYQRANGSRQ
ncbi:hypothetical protein F5878DRAFT_664887, partial [Lentinula raphanica]